MKPTALERIEIDRETIGHALKEGNLYVPIHQRSYKWDEEHVEDLYQDLQKAINDDNPEYFLGSVVVVRESGEKIEVNDGQQRLATSVILIAAIRDRFFWNGDKETSVDLERLYLFEKHRKTHDIKARLHLNAEDHEFFEKRILFNPDHLERKALKNYKPVKESHRRILVAAEYAAKHVSNLIANLHESAHGDILHKWLDYLDDSARVIWVQVADERTAYLIFETMNDRGLKLSAADLLKNYVLSLAAEKKDSVFAKWNAMTAVLDTLGEEEDAVVNFVRYYWIANYGPTRTRNLYDEIKKKIKTKNDAVKLASDLEIKAHDYAAILTPSHERWAPAPYGTSVRRQIETLSFLGVVQIRPILLAAVGRFSKNELPKLFKSCINWSVRYLISSVQPGAVEHPHGNSAKLITEKTIKNVSELFSALANVIPDNQKFKAAAATASVRQQHLARYYLRSMQTQVDGQPEPQYIPSDLADVTLEHILPVIPDASWTLPADVMKAYYKRLGNQALLASKVNSALGNASYTKKKEALNASPFSLTKEAARCNSWGIDEISKRQERLAELAVKTWPLKI